MPAAFSQMRTFVAIWTAINLGVFVLPAQAAGCRDVDFEQTPFTVCEADPAVETIRLFLNDAQGRPLGTFENVEAALQSEGQTLAFAMNGGMYHSDRRPVGLYIENGERLSGLVTSEGPGNFGLLPNGVLCLGDADARVIESRRFASERSDCKYATQSGPMLVVDGSLHPRFLPASDSRFIRNGVGVTGDGKLIAAISNRPVNFHRFGRLFRDFLKTPNALYLDGKVSRLYAPAIGRYDIGFPMGPILAVSHPTD